MKTTTFIVAGMHCDGCAETIQSLLHGEDGVRMATVSFKDKEARLLYDEQSISEEAIVAVIQKSGFRVVGRH